MEKIEDNIFKFIFGSREDREAIFTGRPWSMNGIHLILKAWPVDRALKEISFDWSTFYMKIHDLPPMFIHEETARRVGRIVGIVHSEFITRKSVVALWFLRFRVDLKVDDPLLVGFFQERIEGEDLWI